MRQQVRACLGVLAAIVAGAILFVGLHAIDASRGETTADLWEEVTTNPHQTYRLRTPTGWVVRTGGGKVCFVPDPDHVWVVR